MSGKEKIIDKIQKLKRHAESAESIGNEAEAQAFAEAFQRLMAEHKIEMTDIEFEAFEREEPIERHHINYAKYPDLRERKTRIAWIERLASVIARAHYCRILVYPGTSRITIVGRKQDAEVAEWMIITLQRAAEKIARKEEQKYRWEVYKRDGSTRAAKGFHGAFLQAFVIRLYERYEALRREQTEGPNNNTALVRFNRQEQAVEDFVKGKYKNATGLRRLADHHGEGIRRGRAAADSINLEPRAVGTGKHGDYLKLEVPVVVKE